MSETTLAVNIMHFLAQWKKFLFFRCWHWWVKFRWKYSNISRLQCQQFSSTSLSCSGSTYVLLYLLLWVFVKFLVLNLTSNWIVSPIWTIQQVSIHLEVRRIIATTQDKQSLSRPYKNWWQGYIFWVVHSVTNSW